MSRLTTRLIIMMRTRLQLQLLALTSTPTHTCMHNIHKYTLHTKIAAPSAIHNGIAYSDKLTYIHIQTQIKHTRPGRQPAVELTL